MTPKRLTRILDHKRKEKIEVFNGQMAMAWEIGRLVSFGVNEPKKFPKKPTEYKEKTRKGDMDEWRNYVRRNLA